VPVGFLTDEQRQRYGRFHGEVNSEDFSRYLGVEEQWNLMQSSALRSTAPQNPLSKERVMPVRNICVGNRGISPTWLKAHDDMQASRENEAIRLEPQILRSVGEPLI
jgi:hypothetical protein